MDQAAGVRRVRIGDLGVVVVGLAVVSDVARRARLAWGGGRPEVRYALGLLVLTLGVGVALVLVDRLVRRPMADTGRGWAVAWRVGALAWVVGALAGLAGALVEAEPPLPGPLFGSGGVRLRVTTLQVTLGLVGVVLAASPLRSRAGRPRPRGWAPAAVLGAVAVGLTMLVMGQGIIPYLVLLALEAVQNALTRAPLVRRPIVFDRLTTAGWEALPGLVACLVAAIGVDADFRRAGADALGVRAPRGWGRVVGRVLLVALAAGGAIYVALVGLPALSRPLAEGIALVVPPGLLASLILGYAALAAGLAARGAGRVALAVVPTDPPAPPPRPPPRPFGPWTRRLGAGVVGLVAVALLLAAFQELAGDYEDRWYVPIRLSRLADLAWKPIRRLDLGPGGWSWWDLIERPDHYLVGGGAIWLAVRLARLAWTRGSGRPAALDLVGADRPALGRFLGWWGTLAVAIAASLPGLVVVSLVLVDRMVRWVDL